MKTENFEHLFGGGQAVHLSRDAMMGLNGIGKRFSERVSEDELFETAVRKASDEELRALARLRIDSAGSRYLD